MVPTSEHGSVACGTGTQNVTASKLVVPPDAADLVAAYLADGAADDVVPVVIDGRALLMAFELDASEHQRRVDQSLGPVRSRGLLHTLWALPHGLAWPTSGLDRHDARMLRDHGGGFATLNGGSATRHYLPAGRVRAVGIASRRLTDAVATASQFPPIFRRYALAGRRSRSDHDAAVSAKVIGVGAAVTSPDGLRILARAEPPKRGVPGVYRWWLAEVAYRSWLQAKVH